jgi:flagellar basal body L-ring protein FlgH
MKIQSVMVWQNGQQKEANSFVMRIVNDNLETSCNFYYEMQNVEEVVTDTQTTTIIDVLTFGNLTLQGEEYQTWDADPSANAWAYNWAAGQLNLVLIPE